MLRRVLRRLGPTKRRAVLVTMTNEEKARRRATRLRGVGGQAAVPAAKLA